MCCDSCAGGATLRADLARVTAERDDGIGQYRIACSQSIRWMQRAEAAERECALSSKVLSERDASALSWMTQCRAAEAKLEAVSAQAAAMREALIQHVQVRRQERGRDQHPYQPIHDRIYKGCMCRWCLSERAIGTDAGRAILDELRALRAVRDAAEALWEDPCESGLSENWAALCVALEAAKAP